MTNQSDLPELIDNPCQEFATNPYSFSYHRSCSSWTEAAKPVSQIVDTPWFWLCSDDLMMNEHGPDIHMFVPTNPLWSETRAYFFQPPGVEKLNPLWSNLKLFHTESVRACVNVDDLPHECVATSEMRFPAEDRHPVIFVSNGETNAEENWEILKERVPYAIRVENVQGRREVFMAQAEAAGGHTHFFAVTGKNRITDFSVFNFSPDPYQFGHHWIFKARNMTNGLEYGHMGVVMYSKDSVLNTPENFGLDFTMASPHHELNWVVSEANFATTLWEAWRTAFREAVKLYVQAQAGDLVAQQRLEVWKTAGTGPYSSWSCQGAEAGAEFAKKHLLDAEMLRKTVEWSWLKELFSQVYQTSR